MISSFIVLISFTVKFTVPQKYNATAIWLYNSFKMYIVVTLQMYSKNVGNLKKKIKLSKLFLTIFFILEHTENRFPYFIFIGRQSGGYLQRSILNFQIEYFSRQCNSVLVIIFRSLKVNWKKLIRPFPKALKASAKSILANLINYCVYWFYYFNFR